MYYGCKAINEMHMIFNDHMNRKNFFTVCCEYLADIPFASLGETGESTIENFIKMRNETIKEFKSSTKERILTKGCEKCIYYKLGDWKSDDTIHFVNLSMYPAPCQCKCFYCFVPRIDMDKAYVKEGYEKIFDAIEYAQKIDLITPDTSWQVSSGEITIHPFKDRILDIVKNHEVMFYTNCFKYDEKVAANLAANTRSSINLSIDAGTSKTWKKVKGFNNFDKVIDNLLNYSKNSLRAGQIVLKYIIFPGVNDSHEDYVALLEIMKKLGITHLNISRDCRTKYNISAEQKKELIEAAGRLLVMLEEAGFSAKFFEYYLSEQDDIKSFATKLSEANAIR